MRTPEQINFDLAKLPRAELVELQEFNNPDVKLHKIYGVKNMSTNTVVGVVKQKYRVLQHDTAFRPIVEGLTVSGNHTNWNYNLWYNDKFAHLDILVADANDGKEGVKFGFRISNNYGQGQKVRYGFTADKFLKETYETKDKVVTVWGERLACKNGMKMRIPIEWEEFVRIEEREKIENLIRKVKAYSHIGEIETKVQEVQFVVEAMMFLKNPIERMIEKSQKITVHDKEHAEELIAKYVGRRGIDRIMEQYGKENQTLFGLYNACTFLATHDKLLKENTRNRFWNGSAKMLEKELTIPM